MGVYPWIFVILRVTAPAIVLLVFALRLLGIAQNYFSLREPFPNRPGKMSRKYLQPFSCPLPASVSGMPVWTRVIRVFSPCLLKVTVTVDSSPRVFGDTHVCC